MAAAPMMIIADRVSWNDALFVVSLLASGLDMWESWEDFNSCHQPVHHWLIVSALAILLFRLTHLISMLTGVSPVPTSYLLDVREKGLVLRATAFFTWCIACPFFSLLTLQGTMMVYKTLRFTPECLPSSMHLYSCLFWLLVCYAWLILHWKIGAKLYGMERRRWRAAQDLLAVQDSDSRARWGELNGDSRECVDKGLTPAEIKALSTAVYGEGGEESAAELKSTECSICLMDFEHGDSVRTLPGCGHCFHKSCIDLWLVRCADCPLCKTNVRDGPLASV